MDDSRRPTLVGTLALAPAFLAASISVGAHAVMATGAGLTAGAIGGVVLALVLGAWALGRNVIPRRPSLVELAAVVTCLGLIAVLWDRAAFRELVIPTTYGVDQAHHGALITFLMVDDRLPSPDPRLSGLSNYPIGGHLVAAALGRVSGMTPLTAMWVTALAAMAMQVLLLVWMARTAAPGRSWLGAGVPVAVWITAWRLGLGLVTVDFYFAQAMSLLFVVGGVGTCLAATRGRRSRLLPIAAVFAAAAFWAYPQQGLVVPAAMVLALDLPDRRRLLQVVSHHRRTLAASVVIGVAGVVALLLQLQRADYLTAEAITGKAEGVTVQLSVQAIGGPLLLVLGVYALLELLVGTMRGSPQARVVLGAIIVPGSLATGLALLRVPWIAGLDVTQYRIVKNVYTAFPLLAVGAGTATAVAGRAVLWRLGPVVAKRAAAVGLLGAMATAFALALRPPHLAAATTPLVDRGSYELALETVGKIPADDIGLAGDGIGPYVLWWMGIRRPIAGPDAIYPEVPRSARWNEWPDENPEHYLIASADMASEFAARPNVEVLDQRRGAVLLHRTDG